MFIFQKFEFFSDTRSGAIGEPFRGNLLIKSRNQNIFERFKINRNLQRIPFKMMYNMSMLRHRFSNERWGRGGGGGGGALNHLPLLLCKSVYMHHYAENCGNLQILIALILERCS